MEIHDLLFMIKNYLILVIGLICPFALAQSKPGGTLLWTYSAGGPITSSPALASDGTIVIGTSSGVYAVTNNGTSASNKWAFATGAGGANGNTAPVIGSDGTIYVGSGDLHLYAIAPSGSQIWAFPFRSIPPTVPAIAADGSVYVQGDGILYALGSGGTQAWAYTNFSDGVGSPVIAPDGGIYSANGGGNALYGLSPSGKLKWTYSPQNGRFSCDSPAVDASGNAYISFGPLFKISNDGTNFWAATAGFGSPAIGPDGTTYVANFGTLSLSAIQLDGRVDWTVLSGIGYQTPATTPAIDAAGMIYYCVSNAVWALNPKGDVTWAITAPGDPGPGGSFARTSPILGPDGTIYAALGNLLYAIASGTNAPANSPWPMYRQNARHTGKIEKPALAHPQKRSDANFQFDLFSQQLGQSFIIETSTNLNTWTSLTSIVATTLPTAVADLTATNAPFRFYRAVSSQ